MADPKQALRDAMTTAGITDPDERAGIAAIAGGESGFVPHTEVGYANTPNARIRLIFKNEVATLTDDQINDLKSDDRRFFDFVYGGRGGNLPGTDDGYTYRGRGPFQLTFRSNYQAIGAKINQPLVNNPDLANDVEIGAQSAVAYILLRYDGGGFEAMLDCVGWNAPDIYQTKYALYQEFKANGEFA
jgi:predicted chitinase